MADTTNGGDPPLVEIERAVQARAKELALDVSGPRGEFELRSLIDEEVRRWNDEFHCGLRRHELTHPQIVAERAFRNLAGFGPLTPLLHDDDVWEMLRQGPEVAPAEPAAAPAVEEDEWNWQGTYDLGPAEPPRPTFRPLDRATVGGPVGPRPDEPEIPDEPAPEPAAEAADGEWAWQGTYDLAEDQPAPAGAAGA